jgi:hypothetical protein
VVLYRWRKTNRRPGGVRGLLDGLLWEGRGVAILHTESANFQMAWLYMGYTNNVEELLLWADEQDFPLDVGRQIRRIPVSPKPSSPK